MDKKPIEKLTEKEYDMLKKTGMLWELYPEAPESYYTLSQEKER